METTEMNYCACFDDDEGYEIVGTLPMAYPWGVRFVEAPNIFRRIRLCDDQIRLCLAAPRPSAFFKNETLYNTCKRDGDALAAYKDYQWEHKGSWLIFICADWKALKNLGTGEYNSGPDSRIMVLKNGLSVLNAGNLNCSVDETLTRVQASEVAKELDELQRVFRTIPLTIKNIY